MPSHSYLAPRLPKCHPIIPKRHTINSNPRLPRLVTCPVIPLSNIPIAASQFAFLRLSFSTLQPRAYPSLSPLFALSQLSNARESQALAKKSRLSRIDHSPALEIIRSSEVDQLPFVTTSNSARETRERRLEQEKVWREFRGGRENLSKRRERARAWGGQAVSEWGHDIEPTSRVETRPHAYTTSSAVAVGNAVLSAQAERQARLERALAVGQRLHAREAEAWAAERRDYERERRSGSLIVLASALVATVALVWRWGETRRVQQKMDSPLEQWQEKWQMRETEAARAAAAAEGILAFDMGDMTMVQYMCHEDGCGLRRFATDADFMGHYRTAHPALVEHLYGTSEVKGSHKVEPKQKSWFWAS